MRYEDLGTPERLAADMPELLMLLVDGTEVPGEVRGEIVDLREIHPVERQVEADQRLRCREMATG